MSNIYYLRLSEQPSGTVQWWHGEQGGQGTLEEIRLPAGARLQVLAPAGRCLCLAAPMPPLKGARLLQALPFALEEQLADEVEAYHVVPAGRREDGQQLAVAVARAELQAWLDCLQRHELRAHALYHEGLALPYQPQAWTLLLEDRQALLRSGPHQAVAMPLDALQGWLQLAWQGREEGVEGVMIHDARQQDATPLAALLPTGIPPLEQHSSSSPLALMAAGLSQTAGVNLLSGEFSPRERMGKLWRPWRPAAALLGVWLLLQGGLAISEYRQLKQQDEALYQAIIASYREAFPEAVNIVNPQLQMERQLAELRSGGSRSAFVELLNAAAPQLAAAEQTTLRTLRYRQGELELELALASLAQLETLMDALEQQGLEVDNRGATSADDEVRARLALRGGGL